MKKPVVLGVIFFLVVIGVLIYSSMSVAHYRAEVCMEFQGRRDCRTASGSSQEFAQRSATESACAMIASGVGDTMACQHSTPVSVKWLK